MAGMTQGRIRGGPKPCTSLLRVPSGKLVSDFPFSAPFHGTQPGSQSPVWLFFSPTLFLCSCSQRSHICFSIPWNAETSLKAFQPPAPSSQHTPVIMSLATYKHVTVPICTPLAVVRMPSVTTPRQVLLSTVLLLYTAQTPPRPPPPPTSRCSVSHETFTKHLPLRAGPEIYTLLCLPGTQQAPCPCDTPIKHLLSTTGYPKPSLQTCCPQAVMCSAERKSQGPCSRLHFTNRQEV